MLNWNPTYSEVEHVSRGGRVSTPLCSYDESAANLQIQDAVSVYVSRCCPMAHGVKASRSHLMNTANNKE